MPMRTKNWLIWPRTLLLAILVVVYASAVTTFAAEFEMVSYTAYTSLHWLKEAGVPEAKEYAKAIGPKSLLNKNEIPNYAILAPVNHFYHEMRYTALNRYIDENGYTNVMDIACGFSPRGLVMAREGRHFVAAELEAVAVAGNGYLQKCLTADQKKLASYEAVDATDKTGIIAAADKMKGKICITMDGLMMYLSADEQAKVLQNIKTILQKHGGCFITCDFSERDFVTQAAITLYGEKGASDLYRESAKVYESTAEADYNEDFFDNAESAQKFIEAQGLQAKRIPLFDKPVKLYSNRKLNKEQNTRLEQLKTKEFLWVITAK